MADVEAAPIESTNGGKAEAIEEKATLERDSSQEDSSQADLTKLEQDIIRQIEYYFSENNLRRDKFLISKVGEAGDGWVDISVLLTFNRLKTITEDAKAIADALDKSPHGVVEISEDRSQLRRHPDNPLPEFNETRRKELSSRTAYAKGFPLDSELSTLIDFFHKAFENVEQVQMRKYYCLKTKAHLFKGSVFVTFSTKEQAEEFVAKEGLKFGEKPMLRYLQPHYLDLKKKERDDMDKTKKAKKAAAKGAIPDKEEFTLPKSATVHFIGAGGSDISREDIKSKIAEIEPSLEVAFIHFQKGDKDGDLRFQKENDAPKLMEKLTLTEGKVRL